MSATMIDSPSVMARFAKLPSEVISRPRIEADPAPSLALTTSCSLPDGATTQPNTASTRPRARQATSSSVAAVGSPASRRWVISLMARNLASWRRRSVASRTNAPTKCSAPIEKGARLTSIGKVVPSLRGGPRARDRRPIGPRPAGLDEPLPVPLVHRPRLLGNDISIGSPTISSGSKPNKVLIAALASTMSPSSSTTRTASGDDCRRVASTSAVSATRDCIGTMRPCSLTGVRA